jgi:hypothetical protein
MYKMQIFLLLKNNTPTNEDSETMSCSERVQNKKYKS